MRKKLFFTAVSAFAISMVPVEFEPSDPGSFKISSAYAKSDKGGGNGNGNSGGNGNGNSGGNGSGNSASGGGKSASSAGSQKSEKAASPRDVLKSLFTGPSSKTASTGAKVKKTASAPKVAGKVKSKAAKMQEVAALPDEMQAPKQRNFNAKLAGLNSLGRNINGLLNSQSPRMAMIRDFVLAEAAYDSAQGELETATGLLSAAQSAVAALETQRTALELQRTALEELELAMDPAFDPVALSAVEAELMALTGALDTAGQELTDAEAAAAAAQETAAAAAEAIDDTALEAALIAAANKNRVAEYGASYVDAEMIGWARDVLGVPAPAAPVEEMPEPVEPAT